MGEKNEEMSLKLGDPKRCHFSFQCIFGMVCTSLSLTYPKYSWWLYGAKFGAKSHWLSYLVTCLVGGWPTPLKNDEFVSWDDEIPNIWKNNKFQTTNQLSLYIIYILLLILTEILNSHKLLIIADHFLLESIIQKYHDRVQVPNKDKPRLEDLISL